MYFRSYILHKHNAISLRVFALQINLLNHAIVQADDPDRELLSLAHPHIGLMGLSYCTWGFWAPFSFSFSLPPSLSFSSFRDCPFRRRPSLADPSSPTLPSSPFFKLPWGSAPGGGGVEDSRSSSAKGCSPPRGIGDCGSEVVVVVFFFFVSFSSADVRRSRPVSVECFSEAVDAWRREGG